MTWPFIVVKDGVLGEVNESRTTFTRKFLKYQGDSLVVNIDFRKLMNDNLLELDVKVGLRVRICESAEIVCG